MLVDGVALCNEGAGCRFRDGRTRCCSSPVHPWAQTNVADCDFDFLVAESQVGHMSLLLLITPIDADITTEQQAQIAAP